jgi:hypothetical protein
VSSLGGDEPTVEARLWSISTRSPSPSANGRLRIPADGVDVKQS